jgi:uncharacterized membrane protein YidH (DUF202 family)
MMDDWPCTESLRHEHSLEMPQPDNHTLARDHLANERTFLAWLRTGLAVVVFGFAIGRFAIAIQDFMKLEGHPRSAAHLSVWFGWWRSLLASFWC